MSHDHHPVMVSEVLEHLNLVQGGIYMDATLGRGGHTAAILQHLDAKSRVIAIDKDQAAIAYVQQTLGSDSRLQLVHRSYAQIDQIAKEQHVMGQVDGILIDCGVSSPQLDEAERGFSFMRDGPLDMRMNQTVGPTVAEFLTQTSEQQLAQIFFELGEERQARKIAKAIMTEQRKQPFTRTKPLADLIAKMIPQRIAGKHPATRCFQALRIFINHELEELMQALTHALEVLKIGGRILVISFHSLEDRIVKRFMRDGQRGFSKVDSPWAGSKIQQHKLQGLAKPLRPSQHEIQRNPRARSAILRIAEKIT